MSSFAVGRLLAVVLGVLCVVFAPAPAASQQLPAAPPSGPPLAPGRERFGAHFLERLVMGSIPFGASSGEIDRALSPLVPTPLAPAVFWAGADYSDPAGFFPDPSIRAILHVGFFGSESVFAEHFELPALRSRVEGPRSIIFYYLGSLSERARSRLFAVDLSYARSTGDGDIRFAGDMRRLTTALGLRPLDLRIGYDFGAAHIRRDVGMAAWRSRSEVALLLMASSPVSGAVDDEQAVFVSPSLWKEYLKQATGTRF